MRTPRRWVFLSLSTLCLTSSGCWNEFPQLTRQAFGGGVVLEGSGELRHHTRRFEEFPLQGPSQLDILFVVDNSGTMGTKQRQLALGVSRMVDVLRSPDVDASVRIAVTTSDMGGPPMNRGCGPGDDGALLYSSCLDRPLDFQDEWGRRVRFNTACASSCTFDSAALKTKGGKDGQPPNWLEIEAGRSNLVDQGVDVAAALACVLPQGINGCGYESQLDAMRAALRKGAVQGGFLRDEANLAVIHVTDELDCSRNRGHAEFDGIYHETVFGNFAQDFWVPGQRQPSSATCMMAGTQCEPGKNGLFASCQAKDWDLDRTPVQDDALSDAVLTPVSVYLEQLREIRRAKQAINPKASVFVGLLGGVDPDSRAVTYRDAAVGTNEEQRNFVSFGLGFGCDGQGEFLQERDPWIDELVPGGEEYSFAMPPIRIRAVMDAINEPDEFGYASVCASDWGPQLAALAREAVKNTGRSCAPAWVADKEPENSRFVPDCEVWETGADKARHEISECRRDEKGYVRGDSTNRFQPPVGADRCFLALTDTAERETPDPYDDMSLGCSWLSNVEFRVIHKSGSPAPDGAAWSARCRMWDGA